MPPRATRILCLVLADHWPLQAQQFERARHHDVESVLDKLLVHLYPAVHRLHAEPVERLEPVAELPAGHTGAPRTVVVVRVANRAPLHAHRAIVVLFAQPPLQVVGQLLDHVAASDADGPVSRADVDDPWDRVGDEAELSNAWECCGLLPAIRPGTMGRVCGAVAVRGREEHVPLKVRSRFVVADREQ